MVALDVAALAAGLRLAVLGYEGAVADDMAARAPLRWGAFEPGLTLVVLAAVQVVAMMVVFFFLRLYHQPRGVSRIDLALRLFRAVPIGVIFTYATAGVLLPGLDYARRIPVYDWLATFLCVLGARLVHRAVWSGLRQAGVGREKVLIVGAGQIGQDLVARIHRRPHLGYEVVGFIDDTPGRTRARGVRVVGRTAELGAVVERLAVDEVIIALPEVSHAQILAMVSQCRRDGLSIKIYPDVFQIMAREVQVGDLDGMPLLALRDVALSGWRRILKRAVDLVVSVGVLVVLSPLMLLVAVLVKLDSPGPAFFVQERMGLDGKPFPLIKFRSMRLDAERDTGAVWATRADPRRTRFGRFLREWSLDELPQFINAFLGHMSIVGPRPERPEFVLEFQRLIPRYMERHREKAGITGWAQVNGLRGDTSIEERTKYDLYYIENWSLLLDLKIMAKTLLAGFRDPNAY